MKTRLFQLNSHPTRTTIISTPTLPLLQLEIATLSYSFKFIIKLAERKTIFRNARKENVEGEAQHKFLFEHIF